MLIVCNGAMKSGSTWVTQIVEAHGRWAPIPQEFRNEKWFNPSICPEKYDAFFKQRAYASSDWFCKQHWAREDRFLKLLEDDDVAVVNIVRDLRDVIVSFYFHDQRIGRTEAQSFLDYYFTDGRKKMTGYMTYHRFWHKPSRKVQPHLCIFENFKRDFFLEAQRLFRFLEQPVSDEELATIHEKTRFENKKVTGEGTFFRKGIVGDWVNHLNDEVLDDIQRLMAKTNYPHRALQLEFENSA